MDFYNSLIARVNEGTTFAPHNHINLTKVAQDFAQGELTITPESLNPMGIVHGGCTATLADTVAGTAVLTRGKRCVTLTSTLNYQRPGTGSVLQCAATVRKAGGTIAVCDISITDDAGLEVASGCFTFFMKDEPIFPDSP